MTERVYNIIFWRIYSFLTGISKLINGVNPFTWILQVPFIKNHIIKRGGSIEQIEETADNIRNDPVLGINIWFANKFMLLTSFLWIFEGEMFLAHYYHYKSSALVTSIVFIANALLVVFVHLFFIEHKDKYLKYFKEFPKRSFTWRITWSIISFLYVFIPILIIYI